MLIASASTKPRGTTERDEKGAVYQTKRLGAIYALRRALTTVSDALLPPPVFADICPIPVIVPSDESAAELVAVLFARSCAPVIPFVGVAEVSMPRVVERAPVARVIASFFESFLVALVVCPAVKSR
jgi:hypothetical protein